MKEKCYEEIGASYRFFLGWRHASFAGIVVIMAGTLSVTGSIYKDSPQIAFIAPLLSSPLGIILWMIDVRNRSLYHAAIAAGKNLEHKEGIEGFYTQLSRAVILPPNTSPFSKITQSGALNILFWLCSLSLLVLSIVLFVFKTYSEQGAAANP